MKTNTTNTTPVIASKEYDVADRYAKQANADAADARNAYAIYTPQKSRLDQWKAIMAPAPVIAFTILFLLVSIGEYLFSKEIYRVILKDAPWAIAIIFLVVGVFVSDLISYRISAYKRNWKLYEMRDDPILKDRTTEDEYARKVQTFSTRQFYFGLAVGLLALSAILFLSITRVQKEIAAGLRVSAFGIIDLIPVLLYVVELYTGIYVRYLFNQIKLETKVKRHLKVFNNSVANCASNTAKAINKYEDAELSGFDPIASSVSDNIKQAFFRNNRRDVNQEVQYVDTCNKSVYTIQLNLQKQGLGLQALINIVTDYKFTTSETTDVTGGAAVRIETYEGDSIRDLQIVNNADSALTKTLKVAYPIIDLGSYRILID